MKKIPMKEGTSSMYIQLKSLKEECGGCPTHYTGYTIDGRYFDAYLRHGGMRIEVGGNVVARGSFKGLDGVCGFDDFVDFARLNGIVIDDSNARYSSYYDEMEELVKKLTQDKVWVKFTKDWTSNAYKKTFIKGSRNQFRVDVAEALRDHLWAIIDDQEYETKRDGFYRNRLRNELNEN